MAIDALRYFLAVVLLLPASVGIFAWMSMVPQKSFEYTYQLLVSRTSLRSAVVSAVAVQLLSPVVLTANVANM